MEQAGDTWVLTGINDLQSHSSTFELCPLFINIKQ
jgi:hypothetical protein